MSIIQLKDPQLQSYYDALFEMHGTAGWREMMVDVANIVDQSNRLDTVSNNDELQFRKGQVDAFRWILTHAERTEKAYTAIVEEETGVEPEATGGTAKVVE